VIWFLLSVKSVLALDKMEISERRRTIVVSLVSVIGAAIVFGGGRILIKASAKYHPHFRHFETNDAARRDLTQVYFD